MKKELLVFVVFAFNSLACLFVLSPVALAGNTPIAHKVNGRWVAVDPSNPATQDKSENALEILEAINQGRVPLSLDVTRGCGHMPTLPEALDCIMTNTTAGDIRIDAGEVDTSLYGSATPTVREALRALATKKLTAADIDYSGSLVDYNGAGSVREALDKLGGPIDSARVVLKDVDIVGFGDFRPRTVEQGLNYLASRPIYASSILLPDVNVIHYGEDRPRTVESALATAIARIYVLESTLAGLEARVTALESP